MRRLLFPVLASTRLLLALAPAVVCGQDVNPFGPDPPSSVAAPSGGLPANLVPAQFNVKQDALGFSWMFDGQGMVQGINNCAFQAGAVLRVDDNNVDFTSSGQAMMTPDGNEFVFVGAVNNLRVTRRAKLDAATGSVRFLDTFQNTGAAPQQVNIQVTSNLRTNAGTAVLGPSGTPLGASTARFRRLQIQTTLGPKDCGVVAVPQAGFPMPAAIFYLGGGNNRLKPALASNTGRDFLFTFATALPPRKDITIIHGIAQRNAPPLDAKSLAALFKVFQSRAWTADLPAAVRKSIANLGRTYSGEEMPGGALLQPLLDAAARCSVERGETDVWVQDEHSQLAGKLQGGEITVASRFGKTTLPLDEVALIVGGAGGEDMRLYLRNGEILVGDLTCKEMRFQTASGLEAKLLPAQIHYLFLHALRSDGTLPSGAPSGTAGGTSSGTAGGLAVIETQHGERLIVRGKAGAKFQAATPWGMIEFTLEEVQGLFLRRDPQPVYRLLLKDGSRLPVMLQGDEMEFATLRFGPVKIPAVAVAQMRGMGAGAASAAENDDERASGEPKEPYCTLAGENVLVGALADPQLGLQTTTGSLAVEAARVQVIERREGAAPLVFAVDNGGKEPVLGTLAAAGLAVRRGGQVWRLPAHHLLGYRVPKPEAADAAAPATPASGAAAPAAKSPAPSSEPARPLTPSPAPPAAPPARPAPQVQPVPREADPFGYSRRMGPDRVASVGPALPQPSRGIS